MWALLNEGNTWSPLESITLALDVLNVLGVCGRIESILPLVMEISVGVPFRVAARISKFMDWN